MAGEHELQGRTPPSHEPASGTPRAADRRDAGSTPLKHRLRGASYEEGRSLLAPEGPGPAGADVRPVPPDLLAKAQRSLGVDLRDVRLDDSQEARRSADAMGAKAVADGRTILLGSGFPGVDTPLGERILAHELAHVAQGSRGELPAATAQGSPRRAGRGAESEADRAGDAILHGQPATVTSGTIGAGTVAGWSSSEHQTMGGDAVKRAAETEKKLPHADNFRVGEGGTLTFGQGTKLGGDYKETVEDLEDTAGDVEGQLLAEIGNKWDTTHNVNHFYPVAEMEWRKQHQDAVEKAEDAGTLSNNEDRLSGIRTALTREAFACHFLQDSFAAGHQYPRANDEMSTGLAENALQAWSYHDALNALPDGLPLISDEGGFRSHGDDTPDTSDLERPTAATTRSLSAVLEAFKTGGQPTEGTGAIAGAVPMPDLPAILNDKAAATIWGPMSGTVKSDEKRHKDDVAAAPQLSPLGTGMMITGSGKLQEDFTTPAGTSYDRTTVESAIHEKLGSSDQKDLVGALAMLAEDKGPDGQSENWVRTAAQETIRLANEEDVRCVEIRATLGASLLDELAESPNEALAVAALALLDRATLTRKTVVPTNQDLVLRLLGKDSITPERLKSEFGITKPNEPLNRAGAAKVVCKVLGISRSGKLAREAPFEDVKPGDWYYDSVIAVWEHEIMTDYLNDRHFYPAKALEWEHMEALAKKAGK